MAIKTAINTKMVLQTINNRDMKKNSKKFYTEDEVLDELIGKIGTPERDEFETKLKKEVDETGTNVVPTVVEASNPIAPCTGVVVEVTDSDVTSGTNSVTFSTSSGEHSTGSNNGHLEIALTQTVASGETPNNRGNNSSASSRTLSLDKVIVSFNEGSQLGKFYFGDQNANISIPMGKEEYAIAYSDRRGEVPLNFKAKKSGEYTLTVSAPLTSHLSILNLIDNLTGDNIDLLQTPSYTFTAKSDDYASRFKLVFVSTDAELSNDDFAFISNGEIIINGSGTLQLFNMLGRQLFSHESNSAFRIPNSAFPAGVYVLRLINKDNVRTQKLIVK